jgi:activator of HSP90 ATPase
MTRTIQLAATLPASPERLYDMYLDPELHSAFTGAPVTISSQPGSAFSAFEGALSGSMLDAHPKQQIVQSWRSTNFSAADPDSVLVLRFGRSGEGGSDEGRIELVHVGVPDSDYAGVSQGWEKYYWTPWRSYLLQHGAG